MKKNNKRSAKEAAATKPKAGNNCQCQGCSGTPCNCAPCACGCDSTPGACTCSS